MRYLRLWHGVAGVSRGQLVGSPPTWDKNFVVMTNHIAVGSIIDGCLGARRPHATAAGAVSQRGDGVV